MVPDKFNMVDMGGIDLIMMQGEEVPGLYDRLVESIAQCRYQCLYNWLFDGVVIPPSYVKMEVNEDDEVEINEGVVVTPEDVIHIYSIEPPAPVPVINPISITENGTYVAPEGVDGFNPVNVNIPASPPNAILRITNAYYEFTNWVFNNSDDFDWTYKNLTSPGQGTDWPAYLTAAPNPASVSGNYLLIQGNFWGGRRAMNVRYANQWSGDGEFSYESPFDYDNFYKLSKRGKDFTLYKGPSLDDISTVAFAGSFTNINNNDTDIMRVFWSNNNYMALFIRLVGYNSNGDIIHDYLPDFNGKIKDHVDETLYTPTGTGNVFSIII